jgi:hypothetical protein
MLISLFFPQSRVENYGDNIISYIMALPVLMQGLIVLEQGRLCGMIASAAPFPIQKDNDTYTRP